MRVVVAGGSGARLVETRRTNGLVGFLRAGRLGRELATMVVSRAELPADGRFSLGQRQVAQVDGVGSHISNLAGFVEFLSDDHGLLDAEAEPARRLLLQRRGGERRRGRAAGRRGVDGRDGEVGADAVG